MGGAKADASEKAKARPTPNDVLIFYQDMIHKEDAAREKFQLKIAGKDRPRQSPLVEQFVGRIRQAVEVYIDKHGGSVFSAMRLLSLKYSHAATGLLGTDSVAFILRDLSCQATEEEIKELVAYYSGGKAEFTYKELVDDLAKNVRHFLAHPSRSGRSNSLSALLSPSTNPGVNQPKQRSPMIQTFTRKLKQTLLKRVTRFGGTEESELEVLFYRFSNGSKKKVLGLQAFRGAMQSLGVKMSIQEAQQVFDHFAEERHQGIHYPRFIAECLSDVTHWSQMPTDEQLRKIRMGPAADWAPSTDSYRSDLYRFTTRPLRRPANMTVEKFKVKLKHSIDKKIVKGGDVMHWVLLRAFMFWDSAASETRGKLGLKELKGVLQKLQCPTTDEEAKEVMAYYNIDGSGLLDYKELIVDVCKLDRSWMSYSEGLLLPIENYSARVQPPPIVTKLQGKVKAAAEEWASKFKAVQNATGRDAFHGVCLRFDKAGCGRLSVADFKKTLKELNLGLDEKEMRRLVSWYSVGGEVEVDYTRILKDVFPKAPSSDERRSLPSLVTRQAEIKEEKKRLEAQLKGVMQKEKTLRGKK